jgi:hypothetical protein
MYLEYQLNDTTYWKPVALEPELAITLSNIPAGKHVMRIRKKNGFGQQNYETITIGFSISIPWYLLWWFYMLGIVFLLGTTILLFELLCRAREFVRIADDGLQLGLPHHARANENAAND